MDELYDEAVKITLNAKRGSASLLQRRLGIGYARAYRLIETMTAMNLIGEPCGDMLCLRPAMMTYEEYKAKY